jgi:ATP-dependent Clp protease ATP-binding subunit ClpA
VAAVFERFTERARQVVVLAQDESRALRHGYIGTEHLLLGLLREEEGIAAHVLQSLEITLEAVRVQVREIVGEGESITTGQIPFTPDAKEVLEGALKEAVSLGHNYIGSEHILLGLVGVENGVAVRLLHDHRVTPERVREEVIRALSGPGAPFDLSHLALALERAKVALIEAQRFEAAASLRNRQRELVQLAGEIQSELDRLDPEFRPPPPRAADAARWQYEVKVLEGASDTWAQQLSTWRREGWELLAVVPEGERRSAILERRV